MLSRTTRSGTIGEWAAGVILAAAVALVYLPALHGGFIWDDESHVTANPSIVGSLGLGHIWSSAAADYFPLTLTNFWVQHALWGLNPWPYHAVTIAFHALNAVLLWRVLLGLGVRGAWLGAALWALHPVQVESVAWIAELKNTQSATFFLLAILVYPFGDEPVDAGRGRHLARYLLALICAALAVLSKASTVMLPVVLALCWWWKRGGFRWRDTVRFAPFLVLSAGAAAWTIWEQQYHSGAQGADWDQTWLERVAIAGRDIWFYLSKLIWPRPLIFIYPRWDIDTGRMLSYVPTVSAALGLLALWLARKGPARPAFVAAAYFVVLLFPVLGFFRVFFFRFSFVADHFQYLASMGPLALAAAAISTGFSRLKERAPGLSRPPALLALSAFPLAALCVMTWRQCDTYQSSEVLWRETLRTNPGCWMAHNNLGEILAQRGQLPEAMAEFKESIRLKPTSEACCNLGHALSKTPGHVRDAIEQYEAALRLRPNAAAYCDLGVAWASMPEEHPRAIEQFRQALRMDPKLPEAYFNLGNVLVEDGRMADAVAHYETAIRFKPGYSEAIGNLANLLTKLPGRLPEALQRYEEAERINPKDAEIHFNFGNALTKDRRWEAAIAQYESALRLRPDYTKAHYNLGVVLLKTSANRAQAISHLRVALGNRPDLEAALQAAERPGPSAPAQP